MGKGTGVGPGITVGLDKVKPLDFGTLGREISVGYKKTN